MILSEFLFQAAVAVLGGAGLVGFFMWRGTRKPFAYAAGAAGIASILVSGQSVLTSGATTFSAILFILGQWVPKWRRKIYQSFFAVFKIIWVGIGLNVVYNIGAVFAGWGGMAVGAPSWFFGEAVFAVIILNGVYIGKVLGPGIAGVVKTGEAPTRALIMRIAASGAVSFVSWYSWLLARKGFLDVWSTADLFATWLGLIMVVFSLTLLSEALRRTIYERPPR